MFLEMHNTIMLLLSVFTFNQDDLHFILHQYDHFSLYLFIPYHKYCIIID